MGKRIQVNVMVKIDIEELDQEITKLDQLIELYEQIKSNLFNTITSSSVYWHDNKAVKFYDAIEKEKNKTEVLVGNIKDRRDLFFFILTRYKELGKKITCDLETKDAVIEKYDFLLSEIEMILKKYKDLDISFDSELKNKIDKQIDEYEKINIDLQVSREKIREYYNIIEDIEKKVTFKLSKLSITKINEFEIEQFL